MEAWEEELVKAVLLASLSTAPAPDAPPAPSALAVVHVDQRRPLVGASTNLDDVLFQLASRPAACVRALCAPSLPAAAHPLAVKMAYLAGSYSRARACASLASAPYALRAAAAAAKRGDALPAAAAAVREAVVNYAVLLLTVPDMFDGGDAAAPAAAAGGGAWWTGAGPHVDLCAGVGAQSDGAAAGARGAPGSAAVGGPAHALLAAALLGVPGVPPLDPGLLPELAAACARKRPTGTPAHEDGELATIFAPLVAECVARCGGPAAPHAGEFPEGGDALLGALAVAAGAPAPAPPAARPRPLLSQPATFAPAHGALLALLGVPDVRAALVHPPELAALGARGSPPPRALAPGDRVRLRPEVAAPAHQWPRSLPLCAPATVVSLEPGAPDVLRLAFDGAGAPQAWGVQRRELAPAGAASGWVDVWGWGHEPLLRASGGGVGAEGYAPWLYGPAPAPPPAHAALLSGPELACETFLGRLLALGPSRADFCAEPGGEDAILAAAQLEFEEPLRGGDGDSSGGEEAASQGDAASGGGGGNGGGGGGGAFFGFGLLPGRLPARGGMTAPPVGGAPAGSPAEAARALLPPAAGGAGCGAARAAARAARAAATAALRVGQRAKMEAVRAVVDLLLKTNAGMRENCEGKSAVFCWLGRLLCVTGARGKDAYTRLRREPTFARALAALPPLPLLHSATELALALCRPFFDPHKPMTARIDARFMAAPGGANGASNGGGGGRWDGGEEERLADATKSGSWLDERNLSRQRQFTQRLEALAAASTAEGGEGGGGGALPPPPPPLAQPLAAAPAKWHNISEFFWLAGGLLHAYLKPSAALLDHLKKERREARKRRALGGMLAAARGRAALFAASAGRAPPAEEVVHFFGALREVECGVEAEALTEALLCEEGGLMEDVLPFSRLLAVFAMRAASPESWRLVPGLCEEGEHVLAGAALPAASPAGKPAGAGGGGAGPPPPLSLPASAAGTPASARAPPPPPSTPLSHRGASPAAVPTSLPLPSPTRPLPPPHPLFAALPDWVVSDVGAHLQLLYRKPFKYRWLFDRAGAEPGLFRTLLTFIAAFAGSPLHVMNPYKRGALTEALIVFTPNEEAWRRALAEPSLWARYPVLHTMMKDVEEPSLVASLADFYVDIGTAGSHTGARRLRRAPCAAQLPRAPSPCFFPLPPPTLPPPSHSPPAGQCFTTSSTSARASRTC
jgi:hypothetical protein